MTLNRFSGLDILVVPDGFEMREPNGTIHYVRKGNAIQEGRTIRMVQADFDAMKAVLDKGADNV